MLKAESIIKKRSNIVELFKMMDEVDILKKLNLNENQEFLLSTRDKQIVYSDLDHQKTEEELKELKETKLQAKKDNLDKYLKRHFETNSLTSTDKLILDYANMKVEDSIEKKNLNENNDSKIEKSDNVNQQFE